MKIKSGTMHQVLGTLGLALTLFVTACATEKKKEVTDTEGGGVPTAAAADETSGGDSDSGKAMGLQTVFFPYDSFVLDKTAKAALKANADLLKEKSSLKVQIEGHCDQRGGIQYNIALGEKRANATRKYLQDMGVDASRLTVISFGKEKPLDPGTSEESYAKNRRSNFVVTSK
jgi:peptidoglycan-associated lipoprotein